MDPDDVASSKFSRMSPLAAAISVMLHATVALAMLPALTPHESRFTERAIELTIDLPTPPPAERRILAAAGDDEAAHRHEPASAGQEKAAPESDDHQAVAVPAPQPAEPDLALVLPSLEPPPPIAARDFGSSAPPPSPNGGQADVFPLDDAPPPLTGRAIAMTAPSSRATAPLHHARAEAPAPRQPLQHAPPKRAVQQQASDGTQAAARPARPGPAADDRDFGDRAARQDYLWQVVQKLSQHRIRLQSAAPGEQGLVVARLTIARDGRVVDVELARSSGFANLDRGVIDTIRRASPFAPLPAGLADDRHTFVVPINYAHER